jgi:hypothetical protein
MYWSDYRIAYCAQSIADATTQLLVNTAASLGHTIKLGPQILLTCRLAVSVIRVDLVLLDLH